MGILELVAAVLGSSVVSAGITALISRKKVAAEASVAVVEVTLKWAASLANRIELLEKQLLERDAIIAELRERVAVLEASTGNSKYIIPPPSG